MLKKQLLVNLYVRQSIVQDVAYLAGGDRNVVPSGDRNVNIAILYDANGDRNVACLTGY